jgi:hypothetical protein
MERHAPRMLRGWAELEAYFRLSRATLNRYRKREGAPIMRWGRNVVVIPETWGVWLAAREKYQIARRSARQR